MFKRDISGALATREERKRMAEAELKKSVEGPFGQDPYDDARFLDLPATTSKAETETMEDQGLLTPLPVLRV
jgi:hypothetical protein